MRNNPATNRYQSLLQLTSAQVLALERLDAGGTHEEASFAAGVNRVTVTRWARHHPAFISELSRRRLERMELVAARSESVMTRAIDLVSDAIEGGDLATALTWIRLTIGSSRNGFLTTSPNTPMLSAQSVIDKATESVAFRETMFMINGMYRETALNDMAEALDGPGTEMPSEQ